MTESIQQVGEIAAAVILATGTAIGGYIAKGKFKRPVKANGASIPTCDRHEALMIAVSKLPDMCDSIKDLNVKFSNFIDIKWDGAMQVLRKHEHAIGQLQGAIGTVGDDTDLNTIH